MKKMTVVEILLELMKNENTMRSAWNEMIEAAEEFNEPGLRNGIWGSV